MKKQTQSLRYLRQRKFLTVLPVLVLPFLTLLFWALGGGKSDDATAQTPVKKGFNLHLPDAYLKEDNSLTKMSYYDQAQSDSLKRSQLLRNDPYYQSDTSKPEITKTVPEGITYQQSNGNKNSLPGSPNSYPNPNEAKVYQKLAELNAALEQPVAAPASKGYTTHPATQKGPVNTTDVDQLEQLMQTISDPGGEDPEITQLNTMLEKIMDIQHPERVEQKIKQTSQQKKG